jgi:hypothetical protein
VKLMETPAQVGTPVDVIVGGGGVKQLSAPPAKATAAVRPVPVMETVPDGARPLVVTAGLHTKPEAVPLRLPLAFVATD